MFWQNMYMNYDTFISHIVSYSLVILFVLLISHVFEKRISACMKYSLWLLVVVKLLLPLPGMESPFHILNLVGSVWETPIEITDIQDEAEQQLQGIGNTNGWNGNLGGEIKENRENGLLNSEFDLYENTSQIGETTFQVDDSYEKRTEVSQFRKWMMIVAILYVAGVIACISVFVYGNIQFHKYLKNKGKYIKTYKGKLPLYKIEDYYGACLYGGLKPVIIVGNNKGLSIEQQHMVMTHEYVHYLHGDHIWSLVRCVCVALYWYNPLVWFAAVVSGRDGELACDEGTIKRIGKKQRIAYGQSLLEIATKAAKRKDITSLTFLYSTTATRGKEQMKKRISMIAKGRKTSIVALILVVGLSIGCIGCTFGTPMKDTAIEEQENVRNESDTNNLDRNEKTNSEAGNDIFSEGNQMSADEVVRKYPNLYSEPQEGKVCISVHPSEVREQLEYYYIPEDEEQEELKEMINTLEMLDEEGKSQLLTGIKKGKVASHWSWNIVYDGKYYDVYGDGYISSKELEGESVGPYVYYEQKQELYEKINGLLVRDLDYGYVDISTIKEITSATLEIKTARTDYHFYKQTITETESLRKLEQWFSNAKPMPGVYDCGIDGAALLLKTANGDEIRMSLATDDCTIFAVNGMYYDYKPSDKATEGWYSNNVYELFDQIPNAFEEQAVLLEEVPGTDSSVTMQDMENVNSDDVQVTDEQWATETVLEPDDSGNVFVWPTISTTISAKFETREHPITGEKKVIDYIGIAGNEGDSVYAVADGTITDVGFDSKKGNYIVLTTKTGEVVTYGHLMGSKVPKEQEVKTGEIIGLMGKTGSATGVFLSISVEAEGEIVDPMNYFE